MEGEDGDAEPAQADSGLTQTAEIDPRSFTAKPWWQRCIILVAGAAANFVFGYLVLAILWATAEQNLNVLEVLRAAWLNSLYFVRLIYESLVMLFSGQAGLKDLSGPVGIVSAVGEVAAQSASVKEAAQNMANFFAFIAVNLGVMNLLPIPALDGGRVFSTIIMSLIEKFTRRTFSRKIESYIHAGGFILLLGLMAFTLFNDIARIVTN
jgi:RIP metalloprotease RseP